MWFLEPREEAMLGPVGAAAPGGGMQLLPSCCKGSQGTNVLSSFPLTFQSPASPPAPMAKPNRKLESNGIFNPETTTAQGKIENGTDGFEGQQEHPS